MSQSTTNILDTLKGQQSKLDDVANIMPTIPDEMKQFSQQLKYVVSAVTDSEASIHEISNDVKALTLEAQRRHSMQLGSSIRNLTYL